MNGTRSPNLERVLKLRVVVARFGEMDLLRWWNTKGQLGPLGTLAVKRGLPRTHYFAQARAVFAVASLRCVEVYDPADSITLWRLPAALEEELEARWEQWLDNAEAWTSFFQAIEAVQGSDLAAAMKSLELVTDQNLEQLQRLRLSAEGRAVPLPGTFAGTDSDVALLALGFARGEAGALAVPYLKSGGL